MWCNIAKRAISKPHSFVLNSYSLRRVHTQDPIFLDKFKFRPSELNACWGYGFSEMGYDRHDEYFSHEDLMRRPGFGISGFCPKGYASLAETEIVSSTDVEEDVSVVEEVQELLQEMSKDEKRQVDCRRRRHQKMTRGMGLGKYRLLRTRQVKIETEAWEQAVKEYKELLMDMCAQKLAPNLPYVKSLFLGWFEPLREAIEKEQQLYRNGRNKLAYAPYFDQLPADMMSVITMHKLTGLLMTGGERGAARLVQAACMIGDSIEQEVMVKRQRTAFPPNFIHSLDGSHMMMTAIACKKAGLNFAGVHDSYWTHACDVDEMSRMLREKFVELCETPILENLLEGFQQSFPTLSFPSLPERGDFDLRDVLESPYFFN